MKVLASVLGACTLLALATPARADVSSWAFVGAGPTAFKQEGFEMKLDPALSIEAGMGTTPSRPIVVGGLFKFHTLFGDGTDLALALRVASQGFATGRLGLAIDAGPYRRFWGEGSTGGQAAVVLGGPWGLTLSVGGGLGSNDARHFAASLGVDFARLTVYRLSGENWFPNPHPAYRPN
ncbi:MAG: hypothetical protein EOO73_32765 [Myxococcales bacterium]|nr:MAG: hypothetical protein EOO73_32765 [Myxococcales bacterium]